MSTHSSNHNLNTDNNNNNNNGNSRSNSSNSNLLLPPPAPRSTGSVLLNSTGASEGFYRRNFFHSDNEHERKRSLSAPVQPEQMNDRDVGIVNDTTPLTTPINSINNNNSDTIRTGSLRPPGELGVAQDFSENSNTNKSTTHVIKHHIRAHPATIATRQRIQDAVKRGKELEEYNSQYNPIQISGKPSLLTSFCYKGMEILIGTLSEENNNNNNISAYVICPRTRLVYHSLEIPNEISLNSNYEDVSILSIQSHPYTGQICIAFTDGSIQLYYPIENNPKYICYGKYYWIRGTIIHTARTFYEDYNTGTNNVPKFDFLDISLASDGKILVGHKDQLAVFDGSLDLVTAAGGAGNHNSQQVENNIIDNNDNDNDNDILLWTTQLPGQVVSSKISGDGHAIAVVLKHNDQMDDIGGKDGVHTFERDLDDGSQTFDDDIDTGTKDQLLISRPRLGRSQSSGILYKPGPFLVHSAPVTRISFRGYGHVTSSVPRTRRRTNHHHHNDKKMIRKQGNDLLLTYCTKDCSARIFGQNHWKPLTEWTTAKETRVEWVQGISAFTLGDLETVKKPTKSWPGSGGGVDNSTTGNIQETLGKRYHMASIPHHTTPTTNAGAWVVEISFQEDKYAALRLSRLTYLKRGVDDLNPTLLESISSFLPVNCVFRDRLLSSSTATMTADDSVISVAGIWPAWNPWLSESTEAETTGTLSGSAMSFLGLSSGPAPGVSASGYFGGDSALGALQSPPSELRIVSSHAIAGQITVLEFSVMGDKALTSMELGYPLRSVLSLSHLNHCTLANNNNNNIQSRKRRRKKASLQYDSSRLVAEISDNARSVSFTWRKNGTMSFLPHNWLPDDVQPNRAYELLKNAGGKFCDESLIQVPLVLPSAHIPDEAESIEKSETIDALIWWSDSIYGGSPLLVAVTSAGSLIVFEVAPPWSAIEPSMPDHGKPPVVNMTFDMNGLSPSQSFDEGNDNSEQVYEVAITPDPEYGLGLRLESQVDGMCAIAGSYKRHPVSGETLPAEKSGVINLGDELLAANDIILEDKPFDDIISAVREAGSSCGPGNPIRMKFRRSPARVDRQNSFISASTPNKRHRRQTSYSSEISQRRSMEQIFGIGLNEIGRKNSNTPNKGSEEKGKASPTKYVNALSPKGDMCLDSIVAIFPSVITMASDSGDLLSNDVTSCCSLIPIKSQEPFASSDDDLTSALLFHTCESKVEIVYLSIGSSSRRADATCYVLGNHDATFSSPSPPIQALQVVQTGPMFFDILFCKSDGDIGMLSLSISPKEDFQHSELLFQSHKLFSLDRPWSPECILRAYSLDLMATLQPNDDGHLSTIEIWSASTHPGDVQDESKMDEKHNNEIKDYCSIEVVAEFSAEGNKFLDFFFIRSGYLDASPLLAAFSLKGATFFTKFGGSHDWIPATRISYSTSAWLTSPPSSISLDTIESHDIVDMSDNPYDIFPHILKGLHLAFSSCDETSFLRSDWYPDALLPFLCLDKGGAKFALEARVKKMFLWIASEGRDFHRGHIERSLPVIPRLRFDTCPGNNISLEPNKESENLMAALSEPKKAFSQEDQMVKDILQILYDHISTLKEEHTELHRSGLSALTGRDKASPDLPVVLHNMGVDDLRLLWAIGEVALQPPDFENVDNPGQLFLFSAALLSKIKDTPVLQNARSKMKSMPAHSTMIRRSSPVSKGDKLSPVSVASAGVLAALISNNQEKILRLARGFDRKLTWTMAREFRIPFWERSDTALARLSEEIGQNMFREKRDSMECALFFIISRKIRTLKNLTATDQSDSGRKFSKFLSQYNFSSEKGRVAAEKNAFSLLRKCRYQTAAAFFLLAQPPFLKSAVETIATKMNDLDLAFMVSRLSESFELGTESNSLSGMNSFGGIIGGGGGYASSYGVQDTISPQVEKPFQEWKPKLGNEAKTVLVDRILPSAREDNALSALCLVWLQKKEEAAWYLAGNLDVSHAGLTECNIIRDVSHRFFAAALDTHKQYTGKEVFRRSVEKANCMIDYASSVLLVELLGASSRVRFAASMQVAQTLLVRGVELASVLSLLDLGDMSDDDGPSSTNDELKSDETKVASDFAVQSSIFDQYDHSTIEKKAIRTEPTSATKPRSIFDDYDIPAKSLPGTNGNAKSDNNPSTNVQSSIFDSFDVPQRPQTNQSFASQEQPNNTSMQSSIFDSFDVPPPKPAQTIGTMNSSIFDSFDVPSTKTGQSTGEMTSSIFADFDPPTSKPKTASTTSAMDSGRMSSSIFDSFDVLPRNQKQGPAKTITSGSQQDQPEKADQENINKPVVEDPATRVGISISRQKPEKFWAEWKRYVLLEAAARRLLRETASLLSEFYGDPADISLQDFYRRDDKLISPGVSDVLQLSCEAETILGSIKLVIENLSSNSNTNGEDILNHAIRLLGPHNNQRVLFSVVLHSAAGRSDMAENVLRLSANSLIQSCYTFALSNDPLVYRKHTRFFASSQLIRREVARLSWQLESCLWLHRGGGLPLSGAALVESILAVRAGLLLASWNRNFKCLENMIQSEPDCIKDEDGGRHLWMSLKILDSSTADSMSKKASSGGWEFLVECKRSQATELLRDRPTGCFIIRPHSEDHGVFTLSFKTNLVPSSSDDPKEERGRKSPDTSGDELSVTDVARHSPSPNKKKVRKDDVVQHAIIRLSDSGFRCGSFGPFASLITLLEAVSSSLPFKLRFDLPPRNRIIKEEGQQTSPNAVFLRKMVLEKAESIVTNPPGSYDEMDDSSHWNDNRLNNSKVADEVLPADGFVSSLGIFMELSVLCLIRRQLSSVASVSYDDIGDLDSTFYEENDQDDLSSTSRESVDDESERQYVVASRTLGPLLTWCRKMEVAAVEMVAPEMFLELSSPADMYSANVTESSVTEMGESIEVAPLPSNKIYTSGDSILRGMIQQDSGVEFSTLRLVDGGECTMIMLFSRTEALRWLVDSEIVSSKEDAIARLKQLEAERIIEPIDMSKLPLKQKSVEAEDEDIIRYRFVDPWEVESLSSREGETRSASLGRGKFVGFSLGQVSKVTEITFRKLGGVPLLELWSCAKGSIFLTKAIASVYPPWERSASGDLQMTNGVVTEPPPFMNSIRQNLYRNCLYRRLSMPQRFLALIQVELLDLKNLTTPGGSLSLTAYALLRLKRAASGGTLTNKARTIDSASTHPVKLNKTSGPNAPASWGSVVRFRFPLPEDVSVDGVSYDRDRESLFKGPPCVLQVSVYEKKLLVDHALGAADISTDGLSAGGQLEEWVPLRSEKRSITWFARIRLTLRFEIMCLSPESKPETVPSVGIQRVEQLCHAGGSAHEDTPKRSTSQPDLVSYFENMVY